MPRRDERGDLPRKHVCDAAEERWIKGEAPGAKESVGEEAGEKEMQRDRQVEGGPARENLAKDEGRALLMHGRDLIR